MQLTAATFALTAALLLAGCGQMGPLYQPEASPPAPVAPAATTTP